VVDGRSGVVPVDREVAEHLRTSGKPTLLVVNKVDNDEMAKRLVWEFYELGLGDPLPVSGLTGVHSGDLLDAVVAALPAEVDIPDEPDVITVAVIGKPNVGKSSFLNRLIGEERFIVSPTAGTTRDAIDTRLEHRGRTYRLVDTAGIRRHASLSEGLEYYTYLRAVRALERAQIAIVMLDATEPLSRQDLRILNLAEERRRGIVVAVNKWDLVEKDERTAAHYQTAFQSQARTLAWAPLVTISARSGQRVHRALEMAEEVWTEWHKRVPTPAVNRVLHEATGRVQPPQAKGKRAGRIVRILFGLQAESAPPLFIFFSNEPQAIPEHYRRYLESAVREAFGFVGVPLRIAFRQAGSKRRRTLDPAERAGGGS
jgi:GTP-binding protein